MNAVQIFFFIPPTEENLRRFERWTKEMQDDVFFGTQCPDCTVVSVKVCPLD